MLPPVPDPYEAVLLPDLKELLLLLAVVVAVLNELVWLSFAKELVLVPELL